MRTGASITRFITELSACARWACTGTRMRNEDTPQGVAISSVAPTSLVSVRPYAGRYVMVNCAQSVDLDAMLTHDPELRSRACRRRMPGERSCKCVDEQRTSPSNGWAAETAVSAVGHVIPTCLSSSAAAAGRRCWCQEMTDQAAAYRPSPVISRSRAVRIPGPAATLQGSR